MVFENPNKKFFLAIFTGIILFYKINFKYYNNADIKPQGKLKYIR